MRPPPWSPGPCPQCLERLKGKEIPLTAFKIRDLTLRHECPVCDYVLPLALGHPDCVNRNMHPSDDLGR